jgi:hypothetical protein
MIVPAALDKATWKQEGVSGSGAVVKSKKLCEPVASHRIASLGCEMVVSVRRSLKGIQSFPICHFIVDRP